MNRGRQLLALLGVAAAVLLAGCGGGGSSSSTKTGSTPATGSSTTSSTPATGNIQQAVAECHHLIETQQSIPSSAKAKLEDACDKAGKGDTTAVKQATREVCEELVSKVNLPASARESALAACKK